MGRGVALSITGLSNRKIKQLKVLKEKLQHSSLLLKRSIHFYVMSVICIYECLQI